MMILKNKVELLDNKDYKTIIKKIETCARSCYRSKMSETFEDSEKFLGALIKIGHESIIEHESLTFKIITDRACANQIIRHRMASYSQESTRYVNLSDFNIVLDDSYTDDEKEIILGLCKNISEKYKDFDKKDKARAILPLCTATTINVTMNFREIRHFLKLRLDPFVHPSIREVASQMLEILKTDYPVFVKDIVEEM